MDVRANLRTHDGVLIHYESNGVLRFPPDGRQRLAAGERLPVDESKAASITGCIGFCSSPRRAAR